MARRGLKGTVFEFRPFSLKQRKVLTWWMDGSPKKDCDGLIADGAVRSGKTLSMALSFVIWAMECFDGEHFGMAGKTILSFRRNVMSFLVPILISRGYGWSYNRSDNMLTVTRGQRANTFWVFGGKDERSQDLVQGMTLAGMFFDEVAIMPESFVNQATARCSVEGAKLWFNCNPEGPKHWFKLNRIDKAEETNLLYLHFTMDDNLSLSPKVKARYRAMYSGVFKKRFIDGLWTVAEGIVYTMFDPDVHVSETKREALDDTAGRYISCDYGTQNATVFLLWEKLKDGEGWACTKEYYHSGRETGRQKTDAEYADDLEAFLPRTANPRTGAEEPAAIRQLIIDPAAASFIAELKKRGHAVRHASNAVLDGIRLTSSLLTLGQLHFSPSCKNVIAEFGMYAWDDKAAQRGEDKPVKEADHCMDAVRYFVHTALRKERKWSETNV